MDVPNEVLRPGLEAAFIVATLGPRMRPPVPAPAPLRAFLRFQKLPTPALAVVRKVVEEDDEFRARVTAVATEETVNRASWLWLHRPEGWELELADLVEADGEADRAPSSASAKAMARRLEGTDAKARRLSAELGVLRGEVSRAQDARERAEAAAAKARSRVEELERAGARARSRSEQAAAEADAARRTATESQAEAGELRRQLEELRHELEERRRPLEEQRRQVDASAAREPGSTDPPPAEAPRPDAASAPAQDDQPRGPGSVRAPAGPGAPAFPPGALDALGGAAAAAAALATSLRDLAASLAEAPPSQSPAPTATVSAVAGSARAAARQAEVATNRPIRRRALRIPRGMHVGSPEADAWLLTQAEAAVVVDGYNVAKLGWPDAVLSDQRERLLDVLDDLACRHGTTLEVVFDGADVGPVRAARRRRVAVRFSPSDVLADDVIRELVAGYPPTDPIVVVTNDRAVAHDVRAAGANVVTSDGLLAVARR